MNSECRLKNFCISIEASNDAASMSSTIPEHVDLRESDTRKGRRLEYFTLGWNFTEAVVGIGAGLISDGPRDAL